jgi:hypothetical protein
LLLLLLLLFWLLDLDGANWLRLDIRVWVDLERLKDLAAADSRSWLEEFEVDEGDV